MIPLRGENPPKTFPFFTVLIIIINILVFFWEFSLGDQLEDKINQFAVVPWRLMNTNNPAELLTLITSLFLHGGIMHLLGNMLYLWVFGNNIEDRLGHFRFILFYLVCGVIATLGYIVSLPNYRLPIIGASGAISGILGAYLLLYPRAKILVLIPIFLFWRVVKISAIWFLLFWVGFQLLYNLTVPTIASLANKGSIAWAAHIIGFFAGMLFVGLFLKSKDRRVIDYSDDSL
ncbi:MAG: rhomboid family intramembrane serine protease [Candidatus Omnitrophota bacterium]